MYQLIFTGDNIDQGRIKINERFFTGFTASDKWVFLNSGTTGFSLEISAATSVATQNFDYSTIGNNIIVGHDNYIEYDSGHSFIHSNGSIELASIKNSFVKGNSNSLTGLTNSSIHGSNNIIYSGNYIGLNSFSFVNEPDVLNFNYSSVISSYSIYNRNQISSLDPKTNFVTILNSSGVYFTADTEYFSLLPSSDIIVSGSVKNCVISGLRNSIGTGFTDTNENIYIFGNELAPSFSGGTTKALSGTYINNLCVEDSLILNYKNDIITNSSIVMIGGIAQWDKVLELDNNNVHIINTATGFLPVTANSSMSATTLLDENATGLFFVAYENNGGAIKTISGNPSYFIDDNVGSNGGRWDVPSNTLSANTIFMCYASTPLDKFIRYKG